MARSVLVCMSGGVDSTVAALRLRQDGYDVAGLTFWFWSEPARPAEHGANQCCSLDAAALAARELGIPHRTVDATASFRDLVVSDFVARLRQGETPNPCGRCNRLVRFSLALAHARREGFDYIATGHHARVGRDDEGFHLLRGADPRKDQTYFLYGLGQDVLSHLLLPVGSMSKDRVFAQARDAGLTAAELPESQDLCFTPGGDISALFEPDAAAPGPILDEAGREIGRHRGLPHYTIGQRRGLGIASARPLFVTDLDAARNAVIVGSEARLFTDRLAACDAHFASGRPPRDGSRIKAKIRYRTPSSPATLRVCNATTFALAFEEPQRAVTPGQLAVLYEGERLLGGGTICRTRFAL